MSEASQGKSWRKKQSARPFWTGWKGDGGEYKEIPDWQKLTGYCLALAALLCVFVWYVIPKPRKTGFRAIAITQYQDPVPPNAFACEDIERFRAVFAEDGFLEVQTDDDRNEAVNLRELLTRQLEELKPGGPGRSLIRNEPGAVIIYISAHGMMGKVANKIQPCLLADDSDPLRQYRTEYLDQGDDPTLLPVEELLDTISNQKQLQGSTKLVLLDATRISQNWRMGVLYNSFAERLADVVAAAREKDRDLYVINSTTGGERAWASPEIGGSVFGYCVAAGLRGAADRSGDKKISLSELAEFLAEWVNDAAFALRGTEQHPTLLLRDTNKKAMNRILLSSCEDSNLPESSSADWTEAEGRHKGLVTLWQDRDELAQKAAIDAPLAWARLNNRLVRLEQLLWAGKAYDFDLEVKKTRDMLAELRYELEQPKLDIETCGVELAHRIGLCSDSDLNDARERFRVSREPQPPDAEAAPPPEAASPRDFLAACAAGWEWLETLSKVGQEGDLKEFFDFVEPVRSSARRRDASWIDPPEFHFLQLVNEHVDGKSVKPEQIADAIRIEQLAGRANALDDFRSFHWVEEELPEVNQRMGEARDQFFYGGESALKNADQVWRTLADGPYADLRRIIKTTEDISRAYRDRDRWCSQVVDLAQWTMQRQPQSPQRLSESMSRLEDVVAQLHAVGNRLDRVENNARRSKEELTDTVKAHENLEEAFERVDAERRTAENNLTEADEIATNDLPKLEDLLQLPAVRGTIREKLRASYLKKLQEQAITEELEERVTHGAASRDAGTNDEVRSRDTLPLTHADTTHVALALLSDAWLSMAPVETAFEPLELAGKSDDEQHRAKLQRLAEIEEGFRERLGDIAESSKKLATVRDESDIPVSDARLGLSRADRLLRTAAALLSGPELQNDPCRQLRNLDASFFLGWQAQRALQDFWGSGTAGVGNEYFVASATQYLDAASKLTPHSRTRIAALDGRLNERTAAARNWPAPKVLNRFLDAEDGTLEYVVALPQLSSPPGGDSHGTGTFYLGETPRRQFNRRAFDVFAAERPAYLTHEVTGPQRTAGTFDLVSYYRGHVRATTFNVAAEQGARVDFAQPKYDAPTVQVFGDEKQVSLVMFVLDCSYSMRFKHKPPEGPKQTRLEMAKNAINEVLRFLELDAQHYRVGLIAYGHRAGWKEQEIDKWIEQWRYAKDNGLPPAEDVECLIPLGPVNPGAFRLFFDPPGLGEPSRTEPFGETPLYLAICDGIDTLESFPGRVASRNLIVVTDGANQQTQTPSRTRKPRKMRYVSHVQNKLKDSTVRVEIVYFGARPDFDNPNDESDWKKVEDQWNVGKADLSKVANILDVRKASQLGDFLRESLKLDRFYVKKVDRPPPLPTEYKYFGGDNWSINDFRDESSYLVKIADTNPAVELLVPLEGGEAVRLQYDRRNQRLVTSRYVEDRYSVMDKVQENVGEDYYVTAHLPHQDVAGVRFRVSVQKQQEEEFCPRPRYVWAEIRELRPQAETANVYYFQDRSFQTGKPVPIFTCDTPRLTSPRAEIRLWFTLKEELSWQRVLLAAEDVEREINSVRVRVQKNPANRTIRVDEIHSASSTYPSRVQLDPPAQSIRRTYFDGSLRARHEFEYGEDGYPRQPALLIGPRYEDDWVATAPFEVVVDR